MKPESRENILQEIAEAKQQIDHLRNKQEKTEITLQLLNERLFQHDKATTHQTTKLSADLIDATLLCVTLGRRLRRGDQMQPYWHRQHQQQQRIHAGIRPGAINGGHGKHKGKGMPTFGDLDLDGDGCINAEEFATHQAERHGNK